MTLPATYKKRVKPIQKSIVSPHRLLLPPLQHRPPEIRDRAAIGHVQSQCQGWVAVEKKRGEGKRKAGLVVVVLGGGGRRKEAVNKTTKKKKVGELVEEGTMAWGEDLRGTFITTQRCPREVREERERGVGREKQNIPFSLPLLCLYRSHTGGGELCLAAAEEAGGSCFRTSWDRKRRISRIERKLLFGLFFDVCHEVILDTTSRDILDPVSKENEMGVCVCFYIKKKKKVFTSRVLCGAISPWSAFTDDRVGWQTCWKSRLQFKGPVTDWLSRSDRLPPLPPAPPLLPCCSYSSLEEEGTHGNSLSLWLVRTDLKNS